MAFFDNLMGTISSTSQDLSDKAKRASGNAKLTSQIRSNEKMIEKLTYQVGVRCVEEHVNETDTPYSDLFEEILRLRMENADLQKQIEQNNVVVVCPKCGHNNSTNARFCAGCGAPLEQQAAPAADEIRYCFSCGAANPKDAMFCTECGSPLKGGDEAEDEPESGEV